MKTLCRTLGKILNSANGSVLHAGGAEKDKTKQNICITDTPLLAPAHLPTPTMYIKTGMNMKQKAATGRKRIKDIFAT